MKEAARVTRQQTLEKANELEPFDQLVNARVEEWARKELCHVIKFYTCEEDVADFTRNGSPGDLAIKYFNVAPERAGPWWVKYHGATKSRLNYFQHTSQTQIGWALKSK